MNGVLGAILSRFLLEKFDNRLSGRAREWYKKGILVGKQQYIIAKPLTAIMVLLALYTIFKIHTVEWIIETLFIFISAICIFLEKPKPALLFHVLVLVYPLYVRLDIPGVSGIIFIIGLFMILFDISLMENLKKTLRYGGITKLEREKIKEYLRKEK
jgi:hypothetical protein